MPAKHPYYPTDLVLPGYEPLVLPFELILTVFFAGTFIVMVGTWLASGRYKYLSTTERIIACWFMATGAWPTRLMPANSPHAIRCSSRQRQGRNKTISAIYNVQCAQLRRYSRVGCTKYSHWRTATLLATLLLSAQSVAFSLLN